MIGVRLKSICILGILLLTVSLSTLCDEGDAQEHAKPSGRFARAMRSPLKTADRLINSTAGRATCGGGGGGGVFGDQ